MHAVVCLEKRLTAGQRLTNYWNMVLIQADIPQKPGFGIDVKLGFLGIVCIFNKKLPFMDE